MKKKLISIFRLFLPYVSIVLLAMISIGYLVRLLTETYQQRYIEDRERAIEIAISKFQERADRIAQIAFSIERNTNVRQYAYASLSEREILVSECMVLETELKNYIYGNELKDIYLFDERNNRIITANAIFSNAEDYFAYSYQIQEMTPQECLERLIGARVGYNSVISANINDASVQIIEYKLRVPVDWSGEYSLKLMCVVSAEDLFSDLYDIMEEDSEFYVYDKYDSLIFGSGSRYETALQETASGPELINEQIYSGLYQSEDKAWKIRIYMPDLESSAQMPYFWGYVALPVIACMVLCIYFTLKNHKEILDILVIMNVHGDASDKKAADWKKSGYEEIRESAARLIDENSRYMEYISDFRVARKNEILDKLIRNAYGTREEINSALSSIDFNRREIKNVVLCIRYEGSDYRKLVGQNVNIKEYVRQMLPGYAEREMELFDSTARESVCILFMEDSENMEIVIRGIISRLNIEIFYFYGIETKIGVGNMVDSIYEADISYRQAKEVIRYKETAGSNVYLYSELEQLEDTYYYPREFDELFYNYMISGKAENAKEMIRKLYKENLERSYKKLSVTAIERMKKRLAECVLFVAEKYEVAADAFVSKLQQEQNIGKYFDTVEAFVDRVAESIGNKSEGIQNQVVAKIMDYINEHYPESSLSLKEIAHEFGFQENYISRLFKTVYGENLSAVIEKIRMEKACELLKDKDMKIYDISVKVGYNSDISFRRAFKKTTGISPGEYREAISKRQESK